MGLWSWFKGRTRQPEHSLAAGGAGAPELVLLLVEPLVVDLHFVRGAVEFALGVSLATDVPDATEFITGEFPIFFFQFDGRLLQIKFMPHPYFDRQVRPFVNGEPDRLARSIHDPNLKEAVARHKGWIAVSFMHDASKRSEDPYAYVGKMLSAFDMEDIAAIVWPARDAIRLWEEDMVESLRNGRPLEVFQS